MATTLAGLLTCGSARAQLLYVETSGSQGLVGTYDSTTGIPINPNFITLPYSGGASLLFSGNMLIAGAQGTGPISSYDPATGSLLAANFINQGTGFHAMAESAGLIYASGSGTIGTFTPVTGVAINPTLISSGFNGAIAVSGNNLFKFSSSNAIAKYNATTGALINLNFIGALPGGSPFGLAAKGNTIYVSSGVPGRLRTYNATTGALINPNFGIFLGGVSPFATAMLISGNDLLVAFGPRVIKLDAISGFPTGPNAPNFIPGLGGAVTGMAIGTINSPPTASFTSAAAPVLHCTSLEGATANITINVADANNDPLTVTWSVNSVVVATHPLLAGATGDTLANQLFGFAPSTLSVSITDGKSTPVILTTTVTVADHDVPAPDVAFLPDITGECSATITTAPTAMDECAFGNLAGIITGTTTNPLTYTAQGTYTVTWKYTDPHDASKFTTQQQTVIVMDVTPPTITCPPDVSVAYGSVPAAATNVAGFLAQGGTITDNCDPNGTVTSYDSAEGFCPTLITRSYEVKDAAGNPSSCVQTITVNNLFAEDGIVWHQPLAQNVAREDTDPSAGGTLKYGFKLGSTIPIQIHAQSCSADVTRNSNVTGKIVVFGDTDMNGVVDATEMESPITIARNGAGGAGGVMDKIGPHLKYNLNTKSLPLTFKCYILQVTVTDSSTGESRVEIVPLQIR